MLVTVKIDRTMAISFLVRSLERVFWGLFIETGMRVTFFMANGTTLIKMDEPMLLQ